MACIKFGLCLYQSHHVLAKSSWIMMFRFHMLFKNHSSKDQSCLARLLLRAGCYYLSIGHHMVLLLKVKTPYIEEGFSHARLIYSWVILNGYGNEMLAYYYSWWLIQTKTKFKCRVYNIKAGDKSLLLGTYSNKTLLVLQQCLY